MGRKISKEQKIRFWKAAVKSPRTPPHLKKALKLKLAQLTRR